MSAKRPHRISQREWRAISEALGFRLADECDEDVDEIGLASAQLKVWERLTDDDD